jgi:ATP-binding cassette subfamily F protein uup
LLERVFLAHAHLPFARRVSLHVEPGGRICLLGRNATGKSTLLQVIGRKVPPDSDSVWRQPALRIGRIYSRVEKPPKPC